MLEYKGKKVHLGDGIYITQYKDGLVMYRDSGKCSIVLRPKVILDLKDFLNTVEVKAK